jgi:hypothetical protein
VTKLEKLKHGVEKLVQHLHQNKKEKLTRFEDIPRCMSNNLVKDLQVGATFTMGQGQFISGANE